VENSSFVSGPSVHDFEESFAAYVGARHCIGVGSGTDSLHVSLVALGIGPDDAVITQANTFVATLEAIGYTGARTVLVDIEPPTYTIDVDAVVDAITPRTKAIIPVHLFGQPADLVSLRSLCLRHGITLLEDASQAHGAEYDGERIGSRGLATWSFYPGKNLGALGEAGAVTCADDAFAARVRTLIDHGSTAKYIHDIVGYNYRMDGIQGAVLKVKLGHLDGWMRERQHIAARYNSLLADFEKPLVPHNIRHSWHVYPILVPDRDRVREVLEAAGIASNVHYPVPCHLQRAYRHLGYKEGDFPHAERLACRELSLPIFPGMSDEQIEIVVGRLQLARSQAYE